MGQNRLNYHTLMIIEHEILHKMDISSIINKSAHAKSRKCNFWIVVLLLLTFGTDTYT